MSTRNAVAGLTAVLAAGVAACGAPASRPVSEAPAVTASTATAPAVTSPVTPGSGDCHPTAVAAREILIAGPFAACAVQLSQGQRLHIELAPVARSDGTVAQYSMPRSDTGRVMSPAPGREPCPTEDTCGLHLTSR